MYILYTLEGEHEDIPGHSIRGLEDFSLIASCLLAFKQFQIVCVSVITCLALATRASFLPFCVGIFALGLPLGEGTRSPVYDSHLWRGTHSHPFHQESGKTPLESSPSSALQTSYLTASTLRAPNRTGRTLPGMGSSGEEGTSTPLPSHCASWGSISEVLLVHLCLRRP